MHITRITAIVVATVAAAGVIAGAQQPTDLDAFMRQVLARRDENWKKLQQYVLDERETLDVHGPGHAPIFGGRREYTWYIRDGFFVRSPLKFDGVTISEADRRKYEDDFLRRAKAREKRGQRGGAPGPGNGAEYQAPQDALADLAESGAAQGGDLSSILTQTRQPQFISSAYFLRFKFEEGKYALVGRETIDGRETLRVEYYPARLFGGTDRRRGRERSEQDKAYDQQFQRLMNKVALVTLWIEPNAHQIVKYTFNNVGFDFLPAQWLVHLDDLNATMLMGEPFPGVWLPRNLELNAALTLAVGQFDVRYALDYHDYRQADVKSKVTIK